jgi:hypothetical protein
VLGDDERAHALIIPAGDPLRIDSGRAGADLSKDALGGDHGSRVELAESGPKRAATAVMQPVDRALGLTDAAGDLARRQSRDVTEHEYFALVLR